MSLLQAIQRRTAKVAYSVWEISVSQEDWAQKRSKVNNELQLLLQDEGLILHGVSQSVT
jgi:hypothetical protein